MIPRAWRYARGPERACRGLSQRPRAADLLACRHVQPVAGNPARAARGWPAVAGSDAARPIVVGSAPAPAVVGHDRWCSGPRRVRPEPEHRDLVRHDGKQTGRARHPARAAGRHPAHDADRSTDPRQHDRGKDWGTFCRHARRRWMAG